MTRSVAGKSATRVLDAEHIAFMSGGAISSAVAARDSSNQPSVAKGFAVRVSDDQGVVEVFVDAQRAAGLLDDLRAGSPISIVCSEAMSHRTIQLKGPAARIEPLVPGDEAFVTAKVEAVIAFIAQLGYTAHALRAYFSFTTATLTRVVFTPTAAFLQTPGPGAGAPLAA